MSDASLTPASRLPPVLAGLLPAQGPPRLVDCARGLAGASLGILVAGVVGRLALGPTGDLPWLIAPMGATAVLVFAVPGSPLAQPWSVVVGNIVSAVIGLTAAWAIGWPPLAAALAVGVAIAVMISLRCLHPPGGACALTAAIAPAAVTDHGLVFALWPVGLGSVVLVAVAMAFHGATRRRYPHVPTVDPGPAAVRAVDAASVPPTGVDASDVAAAMAQRDEGLDVAPADVVALVHDAEAHALDRHLGGLRCGEVMRTDVVTVGRDDSLYRVRILLNDHMVKALPVVDADGRVEGIVSIVDLFNRDAGDLTPVASVMATDPATVHPDTPVAALVELMAERGYRHVPVVVDDDRMVGLVSRAELISVLHRLLVSRESA